MSIQLTPKQIQIMEGEICPYCGKPTELINSKEVYGKDHGMMYICKPCGAYVGVHEGTTKAKGRLANKELRKAKIEAHKYFDMIWKQGHLKRNVAYTWLSVRLGLPSKYTHIGMFGLQACKDVIYYSKQLLNDLRRLDLDMGVEPRNDLLRYENKFRKVELLPEDCKRKKPGFY